MAAAEKEIYRTDNVKIALIENSLLSINRSMERIEDKLIKVEDEMKSTFRFMIGLMITLFSGLYATALGGMLLRLCKWI